MSAKDTREPYLWGLFSAGGMVTALLLPVVVAILYVAAPLGWVGTLEHGDLAPLLTHPLTRLVLLATVVVGLFHWAHRFRYTLYDGLQLYHLRELISVLTYGVAVVLSIVAAYTLVIMI